MKAAIEGSHLNSLYVAVTEFSFIRNIFPK